MPDSQHGSTAPDGRWLAAKQPAGASRRFAAGKGRSSTHLKLPLSLEKRVAAIAAVHAEQLSTGIGSRCEWVPRPRRREAKSWLQYRSPPTPFKTKVPVASS